MATNPNPEPFVQNAEQGRQPRSANAAANGGVAVTAVGRVLAQEALGLPTDVPLAPYALERFRTGSLLSGRYGVGAVS